MFPYYGSKKKLLSHYPSPKHKIIIELFAGSASYSLSHAFKDSSIKVILCEKNKKIYDIYKYLYNVNPKNILQLPLVKAKDCLTDEKFSHLSFAESKLIQLFISPGNGPNRIINKPGKWNKWNESTRKKLYDNVIKFQNCNIQLYNCDYKFLWNKFKKKKRITWFIDPPYAQSEYERKKSNPLAYTAAVPYGIGFDHRNIDYNLLAKQILKIDGQVIVCERSSATWLPFQKLIPHCNQRGKRYYEALWKKS